MSAYLERTRRMPNAPLTYISVSDRMSIRSYTLKAYAVVGLHFNLHNHDTKLCFRSKGNKKNTFKTFTMLTDRAMRVLKIYKIVSL